MSGDEPTDQGTAMHPSPLPELSAVAVGVLLAVILLQLLSRGPETRFEDLALGDATEAYFARVGDHPINCSTLEDADGCIEGFHARGSSRAALWLGNSQLYAINQMKPDDQTMPAILWERMRASGLDVLTFCQPNANLQEHLVLFQYLKRALPLEWLILPVVFDDLRETGVRAELTPALDDPAVRSAVAEFEVGRAILEQSQDVTGADDFAALDDTVQDSVETALNDWLADHLALWAARPEMRGRLLSSLQYYRNAAFGITSQSKRRVVRGPYQANLAALDAILASASRSGIRTLVYIAPLRTDVETPYDPGEYAQFKKEVRAIVDRDDVLFADLEGTVPGRFWGMKEASDASGKLDLDFMHFQAPGHVLVADALAKLLAGASNGSAR